MVTENSTVVKENKHDIDKLEIAFALCVNTVFIRSCCR